MTSKIEELGLEKELFGMLKSNPKSSYQKVADYLNAILKGKGVDEEVSYKAVERFVKANEDKVLMMASEKQNSLIAVSLENQVKIEEKIVKLLDEAQSFYDDLKVRESDAAAVKQVKNQLEILKFVAQLTGKIQEGQLNQTNVYNVNFGPSVQNYIMELKKKGQLMCRVCKSTDIGLKEE